MEGVMDERPDACPACRGTVLIKSGHACGRQRWRCKGCGRQFTRTEPRGKPAALKQQAIELCCLGLSMNAVAKRVGVSAQSMLRWVRAHAQRHCPKPAPSGSTAVVEIDELGHFVENPRGSRFRLWPEKRVGLCSTAEGSDRRLFWWCLTPTENMVHGLLRA
jgi:transposase-like protein